jgi:hypothetical protein
MRTRADAAETEPFLLVNVIDTHGESPPQVLWVPASALPPVLEKHLPAANTPRVLCDFRTDHEMRQWWQALEVTEEERELLHYGLVKALRDLSVDLASLSDLPTVGWVMTVLR